MADHQRQQQSYYVSDLLLKQTRSLNVAQAPMDGENEERNVGNAKCALRSLAQESTT